MAASPPAPGFSIELPGPPFSPWLRLAHRWTVPPAQHVDRGGLRRLRDCELFLQLRGDTWLHLPGAGGHVPLPAGHLAVIPPGLEHAWGHRAGEHLAVHADLHAQVALAAMAMVDYRGASVGPGPRLERPWSWTLRLGGESFTVPLVRAVDAAAWERRLAPLAAQWAGRSHAGAAARLAAAGILGAAFAELLGGAASADPLLALLAEAAAGDPAQAQVPLLARRAGMGATAFRAAVRARCGCSPRAHLERLRLERAAYALRTSDLPVAAVAAAAGYADPFHFARAFRRVHGTSPSGFRGEREGRERQGAKGSRR